VLGLDQVLGGVLALHPALAQALDHLVERGGTSVASPTAAR
jgi:hypothetical protein